MDIHEYVKEVERNYREGQNIFRRRTVGYLLQRIHELEKDAAQPRELQMSTTAQIPKDTNDLYPHSEQSTT